MTDKQLKKKIEEIVLPETIHSDPSSFNTEKIKPLLSLLEKEKKEYALSVLPNKDMKINADEYLSLVKRWDGKNYDIPFDDGYNKAIKQAKERINEK